MVTTVTSPPAPDGRNRPQGHCSHCHKVWTLNEGQGVCPWCGHQAHCETDKAKPRPIKSRSNGRKRQPEVHSNGYDQLEGEWLTYYKVADKYAHKARAQDREDLLHTIIVNLAHADRNNGHKPDNLSWMYRIASFTVAQYWRDYYYHTNGVDCGHCSNQQRKRCKENDLYRECPKAVKIEYLSKPIIDEDGHLTELGELIADDKAIDLPEWQDEKTFLLGCPQRLVDIAYKLTEGQALTVADRKYLWKWRKREQKALIGGND